MVPCTVWTRGPLEVFVLPGGTTMHIHLDPNMGYGLLILFLQPQVESFVPLRNACAGGLWKSPRSCSLGPGVLELEPYMLFNLHPTFPPCFYPAPSFNSTTQLVSDEAPSPRVCCSGTIAPSPWRVECLN